MENQHVKIFTGTAIMGMAVKNALIANDIDFIERDDANTAIIAGFPAVHIYVDADDEERAKYLLVDINFDDIDDIE